MEEAGRDVGRLTSRHYLELNTDLIEHSSNRGADAALAKKGEHQHLLIPVSKGAGAQIDYLVDPDVRSPRPSGLRR